MLISKGQMIAKIAYGSFLIQVKMYKHICLFNYSIQHPNDLLRSIQTKQLKNQHYINFQRYIIDH